jgi:hypothetical protein
MVEVGNATDRADVDNTDLADPDSDLESVGSCVSSQSERSNTEVRPAIRADNGSGKKEKKVNRFRFLFSAKVRKERFDAIPSDTIQEFCHVSQLGGRVDTCKLNRQPVIVQQPKGGYQYEPRRSYQYIVSHVLPTHCRIALLCCSPEVIYHDSDVIDGRVTNLTVIRCCCSGGLVGVELGSVHVAQIAQWSSRGLTVQCALHR